MHRGFAPFLVPALLLAAALVAAFAEPVVMIVLLSLAFATFFGTLSGRMRTREPRGMAIGLVAVTLFFIPLRVLLQSMRGENVEWSHEALMFAVTIVLVAGFLASRWFASRDRS